MLKRFYFDLLRKRKEKFPKLLSIELSSFCNAKCIMCPHSEITRRKQHMHLELLEKITDDCKDRPLKKINLFWFGDSLCNKQVIECFRIVRKNLPKVRLYLSTNAGLLSEKRSKEIIDEKLLDVINFDIDGINKETYEKIRLQLNYDIVLKNVLFFLDYKKMKRLSKPQTRVTIIKMVPTKDEISQFVRYWKPLVDSVDINAYNTWLGTKEDRNIGEEKNRSERGKFDFACIHPWDELVISADGTAGLCCLDYDLKAPLGTLTVNSIEDIWTSQEINKYRRKMLKLNYDEIEVCRNCNAYLYQANKTWAKLQR